MHWPSATGLRCSCARKAWITTRLPKRSSSRLDLWGPRFHERDGVWWRAMKRCNSSATRGRRMQHPDEGTIHAWLDGALQQDESAALEAHAAACEQCRAAIAEARGLIAASSGIVSALDIVPAGVIPVRGAPQRAWYAAPQLRAAAAILFVAGASMIILRGRGSEPVADTAQRVMSEVVPKSVPETGQDGAMSETSVAVPPQEAPQGELRSRVAAKAPVRKAAEDEASGTTGGVSGETTESDATASPATVAASVAETAGAPPPAKAAARQRPFNSPIAMDNVVVTGVATGTAAASDDRLTVVGVDSTGGARITRYRLASGE